MLSCATLMVKPAKTHASPGLWKAKNVLPCNGVGGVYACLEEGTGYVARDLGRLVRKKVGCVQLAATQRAHGWRGLVSGCVCRGLGGCASCGAHRTS